MLFDIWYIMVWYFIVFFEERGTIMYFLHHRPNQSALRHRLAERDPARGPEIDTSGIYDTSLSHVPLSSKTEKKEVPAMHVANRTHPRK